MSVNKSKKLSTVVDEIVAGICHAIFRGDYEVGTKLPPLRTLAREHDVTLPTMQRVIARMEELGVISVRQGSGVTVLDPVLNAKPAVMPYWLSALQDEPRRAVKILRDFLDLRAELGVSLLLRARTNASSRDYREIEALLDDFERRARDGMTRREVYEADFLLMRGILALEPQIAYSMVLNIMTQLIDVVPHLLEAMYDTPDRNIVGYRAVLAMIEDASISDAQLRERLSGLLSAYDMISLAKFEALLSAS